jgi:hypothetical protein
MLVLSVVTAMLVAASTTFAKNRRPGTKSIQVRCLESVGAYNYPGTRRWRFSGGIGTAQWQAFYSCLDSYTMKKR